MISLITLWYNHPELYNNFQKSTASNLIEEIIIVNNHSNQETTQYLHSLSDPRIRVINEDANECVINANKAIKQARGDIVVYMSNDTVVADSNWIKHLSSLIIPDRVVGPQLGSQSRFQYIDGYTVAMDSDTWRKLNYYDEEFKTPGYWVDCDLSLRAVHAGMELVYTGQQVLNPGHMTAGEPGLSDIWRYFEYNAQLYHARLNAFRDSLKTVNKEHLITDNIVTYIGE